MKTESIARMPFFRRFLATLIASIFLFVFTVIRLNSTTTKDVPQSTPEVSPLLILFTTVKENGMIPHHQFAFNAVLTNWPSFKPYIRPVIFLNYTNSTLARRALDAGWEVFPMRRTNSGGTPYLKDMYAEVFNRYNNSLLFGYANGDLLFDDGIVKTLQAVERKLTILNNNVMLIGRRTNVNVNLTSNSTSEDEFRKENLRSLSARKGLLFQIDAIDYFFLSKDGCALNWSKLVDVVIGRPGYDNYLVAMAIAHGVNVIDATDTLLAIHVSEKNVFSHGAKNRDARHNKQLIGKFNYNKGVTSEARLVSKIDIAGDIFLLKRK